MASVDGGDTLTQDEVESLIDLVETDGDAATVGDETLTGARVAQLANEPGAGVIDRAAAADAITGWVRNELFYASMAEGGFTDLQPYFDAARLEVEAIIEANPSLDPPPPDLDSPAGVEIIRSQALGGAVVDYMLDVEGLVIDWPTRLCSSHILLETEEEALAVIDRLDAGEDFADLAVELSTGPSGPTGGDLGCTDPASFVPEFSEAALALGGPGISPPVQTQFGWHVIQVHSFDDTPSTDPAEIQNAVLSSPEFAAFQAEVVGREVTIDPRYGVWDTASATVVPANG